MSFIKTGFTLRDKFILAFLGIVTFIGVAAGLAGRHLLSTMVMEETKLRVQADLRAGSGVYRQLMSNLGMRIQLAAGKFYLRRQLFRSDLEILKRELNRLRKRGNLDLLFLTDGTGKVLYRSHNPALVGDNLSENPLVRYGLKRKSLVATFVMKGKELASEGEAVVEKARVLLTTAEGEVIPGQGEDSALVMGAGAPILNDNGDLLGVLAGIAILNRNYAIIEEIRDSVFSSQGAEEGGGGSQEEIVTVFLGDLRISTNLLDQQGVPGIGTRVSEEVRQPVLVQGKTYLQRSLILGRWYITAYEVIRDLYGNTVGMFGVGVCEEKYQTMKDQIIRVFLRLTFLAMILALIISYFLARSITRPVKILAREAEKIGRGEFVEIKPTSHDEIGAFSTTLNRMSSSLRERDERIGTQTEELVRTKDDLERTNIALVAQSRDLQKSVKELTVLFEASKRAASVSSVQEILDGIIEVLMKEFRTEIWSIRLLDDDGYLRIKSQKGLSPEFVQRSERKPTPESYSGECFLRNKVIIVEDADKATKTISTNLEVGEGMKSFAVSPIATEKEVLGVLGCASRTQKGFFSEGYAEFARAVGQQLALAIRNARLHERERTFSQELEKQVIKRTEELKQKSALLAQSEKLAALGEMADRVAHETRNPIVTIGGFARRMLREVPEDGPFHTYLELIIKEVERLELMIFWIAEFKKYISANLEPTNINTVIERALAEVRHLIKGRDIRIEKNLVPEPSLVRVDRKNMIFVFSNLFENAIEAMNRNGVLRISTRIEEDDRLEVEVTDNGKGIAREYLKDIFNPFFTSKMAGAGMGLTIAYKIMSDHNGAILVRSVVGKGTTFTVELPLIGGSRDLQAL